MDCSCCSCVLYVFCYVSLTACSDTFLFFLSKGSNFCDTPTSPGDFTSLSTSTSDHNVSPLTPLSPGQESSEMDIMLPGMPNLRDEDGLPLKYHQPTAEKEKNYKYKEYREHIKESPTLMQKQHTVQAQRNGNFDFSSHTVGPGDRSNELVPVLPPRNYDSQYRNEYHSKTSYQHHQSPARARQSHSDHSNASNSRTSLSQGMDGSLLDLADELGNSRNSSASLHSGSGGRRSQTDLGGALGYPRDMQNGKYSVSVTVEV